MDAMLAAPRHNFPGNKLNKQLLPSEAEPMNEHLDVPVVLLCRALVLGWFCGSRDHPEVRAWELSKYSNVDTHTAARSLWSVSTVIYITPQNKTNLFQLHINLLPNNTETGGLSIRTFFVENKGLGELNVWVNTSKKRNCALLPTLNTDVSASRLV